MRTLLRVASYPVALSCLVTTFLACGTPGGGRSEGTPRDSGVDVDGGAKDSMVIADAEADAAPDAAEVEPDVEVDAATDAEVVEPDAEPDAGEVPDVGPECQEDVDCVAPNACTTAACVEGACELSGVEGCCLQDGDCDSGRCFVELQACAEAAVPGSVVIAELLPDPSAVSDARGEWIEIRNDSAEPVRLNGWSLAGQEDELHPLELAEDTVLAPGGIWLMARSDQPAENGQVVPDYIYAGVDLVNGADRVALLDALGNEVDVVEYTVDWPTESGASLSLSPGLNAGENDLPESWCAALVPWAGGSDLGSPGEANPECPFIDRQVDWCRFQHPRMAEALAGDAITLYGRLFEEGVSDQSPGTDLEETMEVELGVGPSGSDPAEQGWAWTEASANEEWMDAEEPGNDEYLAELRAPEMPGPYNLAMRVRRNEGPWLYCDGAAGVGADGAEDGYQSDNAGFLAVAPGPCHDDPCAMIPGPGCADPFTVVTFMGPAECSSEEGLPVCSYEETLAPCDEDQVCEEGACRAAEAHPGVGELRIVEILYDPEDPLDEDDAEWFEVHNPGEVDLRLDGCVIADERGEEEILRLVVPAGGQALFARSGEAALNGGLEPDFVFGLSLNNGGDTLTLRCGEIEVDSVSWGADLEGAPARALQLSFGDGERWCLAEPEYAEGHTGTPGAANPECPGPQPVDFCRLQFPLDARIGVGQDLRAFAHVHHAGITDQSHGVDEDDRLQVQLGFGPAAEDPMGETWTWVEAEGNPDWDAEAAGHLNDDEYVADLPMEAEGDFAVAARVTLSEGEIWTLCDAEPGSSDGFDVEDAGAVTVLPPAPAPLRGQVLFNELLFDPHGVLSEAKGEFLELRNASEVEVELGGCVLADDMGEIELGAHRLAPGAHFLLARNLTVAENGGLEPDQRMTLSLSNEGDSLRLTCGVEEIDAYAYEDVDARRRSLSRDPETGEWCLGRGRYFEAAAYEDNHYGTPGEANHPCNEAVDACRLQFPVAISLPEGTRVTWYGRMSEAGLTEPVANDVRPYVLGELGYGAGEPDETWTWVEAAPNPGWVEADEDEYQAVLEVPAGDFAVRYRFSVDDGRSWLLCEVPGVVSADEEAPSPCEPNPCDAPPMPRCEGEVAQTFEALGECTVQGVGVACDYEVDRAEDCADVDGVCREGVCVDPPAPPGEGALAFNEIDYAPRVEGAQWFEMWSAAPVNTDLAGCAFEIGDRVVPIEGPMEVVGPAYFVFAASELEGIPVDHAVPDLGPLPAEGGRLALVCGEVTIDAVDYDHGGDFPAANGWPISLGGLQRDAAINDDGAQWCGSLARLGEGFGTPGGDNPLCTREVDWCRLQFPAAIEEVEGVEVRVFGRYFEGGITDVSPANDPWPFLRAELGFGPDASEPLANPAWVWLPGAPNPMWDGGAAGEADNDELERVFGIPAAGVYDYAWRISVDAGRTWRYCDGGDAGAGDGYQVENAGDLQSLAE